MIRPVSMGKQNFTARTILGWPKKPKENIEEPIKPEKTRGLTRNERNIFLAGAFIGAAMGVGGSMMYDNSQTKDLLNDIQEEITADSTQTIKIKDMNLDNVPEIVVETENGDAVYYDFMKHNAYIKMGNEEAVEKLR